jgi:CRP-like cAMP-binding protein
MTITTEVLKKIPLLADLEEAELFQVMSCFSVRDLATNEILYAEGAKADSACFVVEGELEVVTALPGGGEAHQGFIGPGNLIGEMALVAGGSRTATVRACTNVVLVSVSYAFFQAALNQMSVPAFKILRCIIQSLSARLERLEGQIFDAWDCGGYNPADSHHHDAGLPEAYDKSPTISFDYGPFLPVTPFFEEFEDAEIKQILKVGRFLEVSSNEFLFREGRNANTCFVVIRGAVDNTIIRDRRYQLSVLGPGRLCDINSMIGGKPHRCDSRVRSGALLLVFDKENFQMLLHGTTIESLRFQVMISRNQLLELKSATNLLTSLVSQAHVRDGLRATV